VSTALTWPRVQVHDNTFHHPSGNGCHRSNFPGLPLFQKLAADKRVTAELPLVRFVFINLTRLTAGVCIKVRAGSHFDLSISTSINIRIRKIRKCL